MGREALMDVLATITDPRATRDDRLKHKLEDVLILVFCGIMAACEDWDEIHDFALDRHDWFKRYLELPNGIPSADTMIRVVGLVSYAEIERCVRSWASHWREEAQAGSDKREIIAMDGKALRGSRQTPYESTSSIMLVTACLTEAGICLGAEKARYDTKEEHEKDAFEKLVGSLFLKGAIVTIDAGGATTAITTAITAKGADWLIGLKKNQKRLLKVAQEGFAKAEALEEFSTEEKRARQERETHLSAAAI